MAVWWRSARIPTAATVAKTTIVSRIVALARMETDREFGSFKAYDAPFLLNDYGSRFPESRQLRSAVLNAKDPFSKPIICPAARRVQIQAPESE